MTFRILICVGFMLTVSGMSVTAAERVRTDFAVKKPLFPTMRQYYAADYRKPHLEALLKTYGSAEKLEAAAQYNAAKGTAYVLVPSAWSRGQGGWGLYLHVSPADTGYLPDGWAAVLAREKLIGVSPNGIGNDADTLRRMRVTLDAMAAARTEFGIDDKRIFVGGFSGGASIAASLVVEFPDYFRGAVAECKALPLLDVPAAGGVYPGEYNHVTEATWAALRGYGRRWYFGTGTKDFNFPSVTAQEPIWRKLALEIQTEVVQDLDHRDLPAASFAKALAFIQASPGQTNRPTALVPKPSSATEPAAPPARKLLHVTGSVFWAIPHHTATTLGEPGKATVYELGPNKSRKELATASISYVWSDKRHGLEGKYEFKELSLPAMAKVSVEYALNADLDDGNGMHTQTATAVPSPRQGKPGLEVEWLEANLKAKKGK